MSTCDTMVINYPKHRMTFIRGFNGFFMESSWKGFEAFFFSSKEKTCPTFIPRFPQNQFKHSQIQNNPSISYLPILRKNYLPKCICKYNNTLSAWFQDPAFSWFKIPMPSYTVPTWPNLTNLLQL